MQTKPEFLFDDCFKHLIFQIPVYQRNYDWQIKQCDRLFTDLEEIIKFKRKNHFFGCIVSKTTCEPRTISVIDGQQRITTCFLLLLALSRREKLEETDIYLTDKERKKLRLKAIKKDDEIFDAIVNGQENILEKNSSSNIVKNYRYFLGRLKENEKLTARDILDALKKLFVIHISLGEDDNPQVIYETLNATGLKLTEGDKVRNFLLMQLEEKEQDKLYEEYWVKIESLVADKDYNVSKFIRDYLTVKNGKFPGIEVVYDAYKEFFKKDNKNSEDSLKDLLGYAEIFRKFKDVSVPEKDKKLIENNKQIIRVQRRLNLLGMNVIYPFLFSLYKYKNEGLIKEEDLASVLQTIEIYLFRRFVCKLPTNSDNKLFASLHSDCLKYVKEGSEYLEVIKYILLNKQGNSAFPKDEIFANKFKERDFYRIGNMKFYLYDRLENKDSRERIDVENGLKNKIYSIEHIMPQTLSDVWKKDLGQKWEEIYKTWINRIANLTLTAYNPELSNKPFPEKKDTKDSGFLYSKLSMNQFIKGKEKWGEDELEERSECLKDQALNLWPLPESHFTPPPLTYEEVCLTNGEDLTSRELLEFSLFEETKSESIWKEMMLDVLKKLNSMYQYSSIIERYAESKPTQFRNAETKDFEEIGKDLWVRTKPTSTAQKISLLLAVFKECGIDGTNLKFKLKPKKKSKTSIG